ncbi:septum formation protein Maf [Candidatus Peregrinibacteria bacterium]|nr:septum formation protein Maf [Candidatus Peregrinibacteria bacterium]
MKKPLILASESPQRKQILKKLGVPFVAIPARIDEHYSGLSRPFAVARRIALRKAETVAQRYPHDWILGCDTIVVLPNAEIAGKPKSRADAKRVLSLYRNAHCDVYSGLALVNKLLNKKFVQYAKTRIHFREIDAAEIKRYLDSGDWYGRSGSLTIETADKKGWIRKIAGDYWNVVGLPVLLLRKMLKRIE